VGVEGLGAALAFGGALVAGPKLSLIFVRKDDSLTIGDDLLITAAEGIFCAVVPALGTAQDGTSV
jgi:hypothetical protein